jgi:putative peptidoglycan lipid II flippase
MRGFEETLTDDQRSSNSFVLRSAGVMSGLTFISRILGMIRDMVLSSFFGTTFVMDAFRVGFMLPNLFRRLLAEGSLTAAYIPIFTEYKNSHTQEESGRFMSSCFYTLGVVLVLLVVLGILFAPLYVPVIVPSAGEYPGGMELTIQLTQLMFPYILFISLAALAMAGLNTYKVFGPSMFTPILLNISIISCTYLLYSAYDLSILAPVTGVLVGGVLQLMFQVPYLWRRGVRFRPALAFRNRYVRQVGKLMVPGAFGGGVSQINTLVSVYFVSLTGIEGLQWVMYISGRIVEVVHGVYTIALATALLPAMSEHAYNKDMRQLFDKVAYGLRMAFFLAIPASVGLIMLRHEIVRLIFERGNFTAASTALTAEVLYFYGYCLTAWAGIYILNPAFYALKDIWTPVKVAAVSMVVNVTVNALLIGPLGAGAPPLALAVAGIVQMALMWFVFRWKYGAFPARDLYFSLLRIVAGTLLVILFLYICEMAPWSSATTGSFWLSMAWILGRMGAAGVIYFSCLGLMKSPECTALKELVRGKFRR